MVRHSSISCASRLILYLRPILLIHPFRPSTSPLNRFLPMSSSTSSAAGGLTTHAITRQKYFNNALITNIPIVGVQEGDACVVIKEESTTAITASSTAATAPSSPLPDPLTQIDLRNFRVSSAFLCTTCRVAFELSEELRAHSKTPWHVHNLRHKQRLDSVTHTAESKPISEEEFVQLQANEQHAKEVEEGKEDSASSGSGSEGEDEVKVDEDDEHVVGSSRLTFYTPTQKMSLWKAALVHPTHPPSHLPLHLKSFDYVTALRQLPAHDQIAIFMVSGGRFSGAIFKRDTLVVSKNFQRYTTRRKQGGSQSAYDNANGQARSIGSSIRRKETVRFQEETLRILDEWKAQLAACHMIFLFAPSSNRQILMKSLDKNDTRLRNIPFPTYRPTLDEVKRIHQTLTTVEFEDRINVPYDLENKVALEKKEETTKSASTKSTSTAAASVTAASSIPVNPLDALPEHVTDDLMLNAIREGRLDALHQLTQNMYSRPYGPTSKRYRPVLYEAIAAGGSNVSEARNDIVSWLLDPNNAVDLDVNEQTLDAEDARHIICWSPLHKACHLNYEFGIIALLERDANPTLRDSRNRLPLPLITSSAVRLNIRRFTGTEAMLTRWAWEDEADWHVLTDAAESAAEEAKKAKAKEKRAKQKEKAKLKKAEDEQLAQSAAAKAEEEMLKAQQAKALRESAQLVKEATQSRAQQVAGMSEREKRAAAAERRLGAVSGSGPKCTLCANPLTKTPFERLEFKYCSIACLQQHKAQLEATSSSTSTKSTAFNPK